MIEAGQPLTDPFIKQNLAKYVAKRFESVKEKTKIPILMSMNAIGVLDYSGKLKEDEVLVTRF